VFLGAPEGDTALSLLPGHRMMLAGRGYEAIKCSVIGSFGAVMGALVLLIPMRLIIGDPVHAYDAVAGWMHLLLITVSVFLIMTETASSDEGLLRPTRLRLEGHILLGKLSPDQAGQSMHRPITLAAMSADTTGEVAFEAKVSEIIRESGQTHLILADGDRAIEMRLLSVPGVMPEKGDGIVAVGRFVAATTWRQHALKRCMAAAVFLLSGLLGVALLSNPGMTSRNLFLFRIPSVDQSTILLFPLFTGLFGMSTLLLSMMDAPTIPKQRVDDVRVRLALRKQAKSVLSGCAASSASWFPGISAAISTIISVFLHKGSDADEIGSQEGDEETQEFLISVSAVNTSVALFNLMALFVIMKSRSGAMKAVEGILAADLSPWEPLGNVPVALAAMLLSAVVASIASIYLALFFGRLFAKHCSKINYPKLVKGVVVFLLAMIVVFSGLVGLVILAISTCVGMIPPLIGVKRVHLMGCLIVPVILFFL
jgi:TctA family transporter